MLHTGSLLANDVCSTGMAYRRNRFYDGATGQFNQQDPIGLAGGANAYGFAGGDPISYSDPFGLCPGVNGTDQLSVDDCPDESTRTFWDRLWNGTRYVEVDGRRYRLLTGHGPTDGAGGSAQLLRSAATLARHSKRFANAVKSLDASHLEIASRELAGAVTGWDHVTEVRNAMNAMRGIVRSMTGYLRNPNLTAEMRKGAEQLLRNAQEALERAEQVIP